MAELSLGHLYKTKSDKGHTHDGTEITSTVANATNAVNAVNATNATNAIIATNAVNASNVPFSGISNKPTTLTGYGIIDAANKVHTHDAADITGNVSFANYANTAATTTGNAATATKLQNGATINGVDFDGSKNITIDAITNSEANKKAKLWAIVFG